MKIIRASEIGTYQFCHRAWWYQQQGVQPDNQAEIAWGNQIHEKHGRSVVTNSCLQAIAYAALLIAVLAVIVWLIQSIM